MAASMNVRVQLFFNNIPNFERTNYRYVKCWYLVNKSDTLTTIDQLIREISKRFGLNISCDELQLSLDGCLLPNWENVDILRDDDLITISYRACKRLLVENESESTTRKRHKKGRKERNVSQDCEHELNTDIFRCENNTDSVDVNLSGNNLRSVKYNESDGVLPTKSHLSLGLDSNDDGLLSSFNAIYDVKESQKEIVVQHKQAPEVLETNEKKTKKKKRVRREENDFRETCVSQCDDNEHRQISGIKVKDLYVSDSTKHSELILHSNKSNNSTSLERDLETGIGYASVSSKCSRSHVSAVDDDIEEEYVFFNINNAFKTQLIPQLESISDNLVHAEQPTSVSNRVENIFSNEIINRSCLELNSLSDVSNDVDSGGNQSLDLTEASSIHLKNKRLRNRRKRLKKRELRRDERNYKIKYTNIPDSPWTVVKLNVDKTPSTGTCDFYSRQFPLVSENVISDVVLRNDEISTTVVNHIIPTSLADIPMITSPGDLIPQIVTQNHSDSVAVQDVSMTASLNSVSAYVKKSDNISSKDVDFTETSSYLTNYNLMNSINTTQNLESMHNNESVATTSSSFNPKLLAPDSQNKNFNKRSKISNPFENVQVFRRQRPVKTSACSSAVM